MTGSVRSHMLTYLSCPVFSSFFLLKFSFMVGCSLDCCITLPHIQILFSPPLEGSEDRYTSQAGRQYVSTNPAGSVFSFFFCFLVYFTGKLLFLAHLRRRYDAVGVEETV